MKPERGDRLETEGVISQPTQRFLEGLQPPEVVGELSNPTLETVRRLWWRAFDRVCDWIEIMKLPIQDRIFGPEPPTSADLQREANRRAFRVVAEIDTDPPACTISGTPNGSPDLVFCSKLSMSEGSLTGRLSLWRGFWMVVSVSP
jgi:hypothetical protein